MCGIAAIVSHRSASQDLYDALIVLQHRGEEAAGIVTCEKGRLHLHKGTGLASDVFTNARMLKLKGTMGIAHVHNEKVGYTISDEVPPFYVNSPFGLTLAHNGNLTNTGMLKKAMLEDKRHINTDSDSEVLLNVFAYELQRSGKLHLCVDDIFQAVSCVHRRCHGAYAVVIMIAGVGILGFRDPHGIRPIGFGSRTTERGPEVMIASESVALDVLGFEFIRDISPGEAVFIEESGVLHSRQCADQVDLCPCIFEYVYFARPDSIIDDISVYEARLRMGEKLAAKVLREWADYDIDVVIPISDTSRTSALQISTLLGIDHREGFIQNSYIGQAAIIPSQKMRENLVKRKLNTISLEFEGKNVLLVDHSIVRGTTSAQIIQMARNAGARKVYLASTAPPIRYPNVYGINVPTAQELVAHNRSEEEVRVAIGADRVIYQELNDLVDAVSKGNLHIKHFDTSCISNEYITGDHDDAIGKMSVG